jgi:hypothetical protein
MRSISWKQYKNRVLVRNTWNIILPRGVLTWIIPIDIVFPFPKQILWFLAIKVSIEIIRSSF